MCEKPKNTGTSRVCRQESGVRKTAEYRFAGTSPRGRFRPRVNKIDTGTTRVDRIDVLGFWGLLCEQDRCFLSLSGLCERVRDYLEG